MIFKNNFPFKAYRELLEKMRDGRDSQIHLITQEIKRLQGEIERQNNRDLIAELYNSYGLTEKEITLQEFRHGVYTEGR